MINGVDVGDGDPISVKVRKQIDATNWDEAETFVDSFGRAVKTQAKDSQGDVFVETEYDLLGRVKRTSNPYRLSEVQTDGTGKFWSNPRYDALGRVYESCVSVANAQSNPSLPCPSGTSTGITSFAISDVTNFVGTVVTSTDASGRKARSITNGLGQLIRVDEATATGGDEQADLGSLESPNQPTFYNYSPQGQMVKVQQGNQNRYFKYDSLGRLIRVKQPEQVANDHLDLADDYNSTGKWSAAFSYDLAGNLRRATDAEGINIISEYDKANRAIRRCYTKPQIQTSATACVELTGEQASVNTPSVIFFYDGFMEQSQPPTASPNYAKGKLTRVDNGISQTRYLTFDNLGRLTSSEQKTPVETETMANAPARVSLYEYDFAGALIKETYPSGRTVENQFESDGDLMRVFGKANSSATERTYANSFSYTASGGISQLRLGNGRWESAKFNERLQLTELGLGFSSVDASLWKVNYDYGELENGSVNTNKNTGNIARQTLSFVGLQNPIVQIYKYDSLERLIEAKETSGTATNAPQNWIQNFGYDRFGNRISFNQQIGQTTLNQTPAINPNTNRFSGSQFGYDKNGNIITDIDPLTSLSRTFIFNGENKQTEVKNSSGATIGRYFYDGEGNRVKKETATETTVFVYSAGKLIAEYSTQTTPLENRTTSYTTTDHLGSPRVITDALGQVKSRRDFMPFGEDLTVNVGARSTALKYGTSDNIRQKFTGYQKDAETSLDFAEARMYENRHGRFTAVDPLLASGKSANPQTFNRYVYVGNNPIIRIDPNGEVWIISKKPDKNGLYTYKDAYGKTLKKLLASGNYNRVDFNGNSSKDITGYRLGEAAGIYRLNAAGDGRWVRNFAEERKKQEKAERDSRDNECNANCQELIQQLGGRAPAMMKIINTGAIISTAIVAAPYVAGALAGGGGSQLISLGLSNPATTTATTFGTVAATNSDKTSRVITTLAETPSSILKPFGELIGTAGSKPTIREMSGGVNAAQSMFSRLISNGAQLRFAPNYKGFLYDLPNGGSVGWRTVMSRSPNTQVTIDVNIPNVIRNGKLKF